MHKKDGHAKKRGRDAETKMEWMDAGWERRALDNAGFLKPWTSPRPGSSQAKRWACKKKGRDAETKMEVRGAPKPAYYHAPFDFMHLTFFYCISSFWRCPSLSLPSLGVVPFFPCPRFYLPSPPCLAFPCPRSSLTFLVPIACFFPCLFSSLMLYQCCPSFVPWGGLSIMPLFLLLCQ